MSPKQRIWITGAHGFIGRHLAAGLAADGGRVAGIGHGHWPAPEAARWGVDQWLNGEISASNLHALQSVTGLPDVVVHLAGGSTVGAALAQPREDFERTVSTTVELLEWIRLNAPQTCVVAVSSAAVYGAAHAGPIPEGTPLEPYSPYGWHKAMMESLCRSYASSFGLRCVVARLFSVYGAGLRKQLLWDLCTRLAGDESSIELGGTGDERRDWTDVRDVVRAIARLPAIADARVPVVNVGSGVATPVRDIARAIVSRWDAGRAPRAISFSGRSRRGDPFSLQADSACLARMGHTWQVPWQQGIADYVDWFRAQSPREG